MRKDRTNGPQTRQHAFTANPASSHSRLQALLPGHKPLHVLPTLVLLLKSVAKAVLMQRLHYWLVHNSNSESHVKDGRPWVRFTYEGLADDLQHAWKPETIGGHVRQLRKLGFIVHEERQKDEYWYTIDYERLVGHAREKLPAEAPHTIGSLLKPKQTRLLYPRLVKVLRMLGDGDAAINRALLLQQVHFWSGVHRHNIHDGLPWVERPVRQWQEVDFPFLSTDAINNGLSTLAEYGIVTRRKFRRYRRHTYSYAINNEFIEQLLSATSQKSEHKRLAASGHKSQPETGNPGCTEPQITGCTKPEIMTCTEPEMPGCTEPEIYIENTPEKTKENSVETPVVAFQSDVPAVGSATLTFLKDETQNPVTQGVNLIPYQFSAGFLATLYAEHPGRQAAWARLTDTEVEASYRTARRLFEQPGTASKPDNALGTHFKNALDKAADLGSAVQEEEKLQVKTQHARNKAAKRRSDLAVDKAHEARDNHPSDDWDELDEEYERVYNEIIKLPLRQFMDLPADQPSREQPADPSVHGPPPIENHQFISGPAS